MHGTMNIKCKITYLLVDNSTKNKILRTDFLYYSARGTCTYLIPIYIIIITIIIIITVFIIIKYTAH